MLLSVSPMMSCTPGVDHTIEEPGRYPAPCPVEPGLSSPPILRLLSGRGSGHPAYPAPRATLTFPRTRGQGTKFVTGLADVEDSATTVAQHWLTPRPSTLELMGGKGHTAGATQSPLYLGYR